MIQEAMTIKHNIYPKFIVENEQRQKKIFIKHLKKAGVLIGFELGKKFDFVIDDNNSKIIEQLWFYATNNNRFIGDHQKGLLISGNIGTGKTILLLAFLEVIKHTFKRNYTALFPDTIHDNFKSKGLMYFKLKDLFIDDLCREPNNVMEYGKKINPVRELTMLRDRFPCQSYATANFPVYRNGKLLKSNELITRYGTMVFDRMKASYNFLELIGKSRR